MATGVNLRDEPRNVLMRLGRLCVSRSHVRLPSPGCKPHQSVTGVFAFLASDYRKDHAGKARKVSRARGRSTKGSGAGVDTRHSPPNWTRPAAIALLRNTTPRSSELSTGGNQSCPGHEIVINES